MDWTEPQRVQLAPVGVPALDGCEFILGTTMWFCTARPGFSGMEWFSARQIEGRWMGWEASPFPHDYEVGELHITADGRELYFHSPRRGGLSEFDIWLSENAGGTWQVPIDLHVVNSPYTDGWPFISPDGAELWFTRIVGAPSLWRSVRAPGQWAEPVEMFSPFSAEASLDNNGNVCFTHHFYRDNKMLESDIYVAYPRVE